MYESITYAELKSLPKEQKIEALKELKALYSSQKKIAEKLGVNPPNIYNMISRYIKEDSDAKTGKKGAAKNRTAGSRQERMDAAGSRRKRNDVGSRQERYNTPDSRQKSFDVVDKQQERYDTADNRQKSYDAVDKQQERYDMPVKRQDSFDAARNEQFSDRVTGDDQIRTEIPGNDKIAAEGTKAVEYYSRNDFLISIAKELTGEEAQSILAGIGNIFLKNREYRIDIKITEK